MRHEWPPDEEQHLWGRWFSKDQNTKYRCCVHPDCPEVQERPANEV